VCDINSMVILDCKGVLQSRAALYRLADMRGIHFSESKEIVASNNATKSDI
jgi:hypothetical protein